MEASRNKPIKSVSFSGCFYLLLNFWAVLLIIDRLTLSPGFVTFFKSAPGKTGLAILVIAAAAAAFKTRSHIYRILTGKTFAAAILAWLLAFTILGTLIIQTASRDELSNFYRARFSRLIYLSGMSDIFHSLWFGGFLVLLALSLILVMVKRKSWRIREWGNLLSHLGVVAVIAGGFIGYFYGSKGMMGLNVGGSSNQAVEMKPGAETKNRQHLDFSVLLEGFTVERYEPEYTICLYRKKGGSFELKKSFGLTQVGNWTRTDSPRESFRVAKIYPDFYLQTELKQGNAENSRRGIELEIADGQAKRKAVIFAGENNSEAVVISGQGEKARFVWETPDEKELAGFAGTRDGAHILFFEQTGCCPQQELEVEPGGKYMVSHGGRYELEVIQYLPDFIYDIKTRKADTRSQQPDNPALELEVTEAATGVKEKRWLFSNAPQFAAAHREQERGPELIYKYAASEPPLRQLILVGKTREAIELEPGKKIRRHPLPADGKAIPATNISGFKIFASAQEYQRPATYSEQWKNPAAEIEFSQGSEVSSRILVLDSRPLFLPRGSALAFRKTGGDVKAFRSRIAILKDGRQAASKTITVNNPLRYRGYAFYQSKFDEQDPTFSGILVVKDPGLALVWIGLGMICLGPVFAFYVKPALGKHKGFKDDG